MTFKKIMRKRRVDIYSKIVNSLKSDSKTILQVSKDVEINWETTKNAIAMLEEIGVISSENKNGKTYYFVDESRLVKFNENTLLGLPLTKEQENKTISLFNRFINRWHALGISKRLNKTFLQKMLIKLVKEEKINDVPYGWYLFGECAVLQCDPSFTNSSVNIGNQFDSKIDNIIKEYAQIPTTKELMQKHYSEEANEVYLIRLKISEILMNEFNESNINALKRNLRSFLFSFKKDEENQEIISYLNVFVSIMIRLINGVNVNELEDIRDLINDTFKSVWEIVATYNLYHSLLEKDFYEKATIKKYYSIRLENLKHVADSYLSALKDYCPPLIVSEDNPLRKFKGILASQSR